MAKNNIIKRREEEEHVSIPLVFAVLFLLIQHLSKWPIFAQKFHFFPIVGHLFECGNLAFLRF